MTTKTKEYKSKKAVCGCGHKINMQYTVCDCNYLTRADYHCACGRVVTVLDYYNGICTHSQILH